MSGSVLTGNDKVALATSSLVGKQFFAVGFDSSNRGQIVLANAQTVEAAGILQDEPAAAAYGTIRMAGDSFAIVGGTVHVDDKLTADATGKLVATTAAGDKIVAVALEEGVSGDRISVQITQAYYN